MKKSAALALVLVLLASVHASPVAPDLSKIGDRTSWKVIHADAQEAAKGARSTSRPKIPPDPDGWLHAGVEVTASQVRVFVDHAKEPSLVVARLSSGGVERPFGLFIDSADGEYANLTVAAREFLSR
ncbi:MAG: hypothetical protein HY854_09635 [Burkholderiales bacterium]|nr:hypothetical protein [Burkholderiales bacterium]